MGRLVRVSLGLETCCVVVSLFFFKFGEDILVWCESVGIILVRFVLLSLISRVFLCFESMTRLLEMG